jgi:hypothetical protein
MFRDPYLVLHLVEVVRRGEPDTRVHERESRRLHRSMCLVSVAYARFCAPGGVGSRRVRDMFTEKLVIGPLPGHQQYSKSVHWQLPCGTPHAPKWFVQTKYCVNEKRRQGIAYLYELYLYANPAVPPALELPVDIRQALACSPEFIKFLLEAHEPRSEDSCVIYFKWGWQNRPPKGFSVSLTLIEKAEEPNVPIGFRVEIDHMNGKGQTLTTVSSQCDEIKSDYFSFENRTEKETRVRDAAEIACILNAAIQMACQCFPIALLDEMPEFEPFQRDYVRAMVHAIHAYAVR